LKKVNDDIIESKKKKYQSIQPEILEKNETKRK
jgi:hypothetical protein